MVEAQQLHTRPAAVAPDLAADAAVDNEVRLWTVHLDLPAQSRASLEAVLSESEQNRAMRFRFDLHRHRYTCCRGALRMILSQQLDRAPEEIHFEYGPHGKPSVRGLHFNVAHSNDLALIAVTKATEIGIDIEAVRRLNDFDELVSRFFCPRESKLFAELPDEMKPAAFFNLWTRKEALLKATGEGIGYSLNRVDVTFLPGEPACLLSMPGDDSCHDWTLKELAVAPGFAGALAIKRPDVTLRFWESPV